MHYARVCGDAGVNKPTGQEKTRLNSDVECTASSGWFKQLKICYSFYNMKVNGESVSADVKAIEEFLQTLNKWMVEEIYLPEQIFNVDENLPLPEMDA